MRRARWRLRYFPECARPTEGSHTRTTRGPAQRRGGRKAKAALSNRGGVEQRGKQHTHYKGRDALKHNSEPGHLGSCMAYRGGAMQEFSEWDISKTARPRALYKGRSPKAPTRRMKRPGRGGRRGVL